MNKFIKGNSLIEIVIAMAIITIILVITVPRINDFRTHQTLKNTASEVVNLLNEAKTSTLFSKNSTVYGVHFETSRMVLFTGTTFSDSAVTNKVITFDSLVTLPSGNIVLNGNGVDIVFDRLTGNTSNHGTITLELAGNSSLQKIITVSTLGVISLN
jgi:Tfp pilus assembly protein FimT